MKTSYTKELAEALFQEAGDALFLFEPDTDRLVDVNPVAQRLSGFSRDELLNMQATQLYRAEMQGNLARLRQATQNTGIFHSQEGFFLRTKQEGHWVPVNLTIARLHVRPKTLGLITARDIREQRLAHERLKKMEAELRDIMVSISDCLWSADVNPQGHWEYRYFSPVIEKITGRPPEFFLPGVECWRSTIHPRDRGRWQEMLRRLWSERASQAEYRILRPDQSIRWVRDSIMVRHGSNGRPLRLDGVLTDISERKYTEEELLRTAGELARSNEELERFAYVASHDLQEPLRMITSYGRLLQQRYQGKLDQDGDDFLAFLVDGAGRMQGLIADLLAYARAGKHDRPVQQVDIGQALGHALDNLRAAIDETGARVTHGRLPTVAGDFTQLVQLFQNLIGNAIKFRGEQTPTIHVDAAPRLEGDWLFSVRDNGLGIDPKLAPRLFVIFQRGSVRRGPAGSGIGLAVCKKIVQRHGGTIWVDSQPGQGCVFHFTLPALAQAAKPQPQPEFQASGA